MFGKKTKRIKELEEMLEAEYEDFKQLYDKHCKLQLENENLRLHNGRLMNEVGRLQSQVQRVGLVRDNKGIFRAAK